MTYAEFNSAQGFTFAAGGNSVVQTMSAVFNNGVPYVMTAMEDLSDVITPSLGSATPNTISSGLAAYTGTGYLAGTSVGLAASMSNGDYEANILGGVTAAGTATFSITYNYALVPEPTSMALLALGIGALGLRRRSIKA